MLSSFRCHPVTLARRILQGQLSFMALLDIRHISSGLKCNPGTAKSESTELDHNVGPRLSELTPHDQREPGGGIL